MWWSAVYESNVDTGVCFTWPAHGFAVKLTARWVRNANVVASPVSLRPLALRGDWWGVGLHHKA